MLTNTEQTDDSNPSTQPNPDNSGYVLRPAEMKVRDSSSCSVPSTTSNSDGASGDSTNDSKTSTFSKDQIDDANATSGSNDSEVVVRIKDGLRRNRDSSTS